MKYTKADERRVKRWITQWQKTLNLHDWDIYVVFEKDDKDTTAANTIREFNYLRATITIFHCFFEDKLEDQWKHIVHEMIHVMLASYDQALIGARDGRAIPQWDVDRIRETTTVRFTSLLTSAWPWKKDV